MSDNRWRVVLSNDDGELEYSCDDTDPAFVRESGVLLMRNNSGDVVTAFAPSAWGAVQRIGDSGYAVGVLSINGIEVPR